MKEGPGKRPISTRQFPGAGNQVELGPRVCMGRLLFLLAFQEAFLTPVKSDSNAGFIGHAGGVRDEKRGMGEREGKRRWGVLSVEGIPHPPWVYPTWCPGGFEAAAVLLGSQPMGTHGRWPLGQAHSTDSLRVVNLRRATLGEPAGLQETEMQSPYLGRGQRPFNALGPQCDMKDPGVVLLSGRKDIPDTGGGHCFRSRLFGG